MRMKIPLPSRRPVLLFILFGVILAQCCCFLFLNLPNLFQPKPYSPAMPLTQYCALLEAGYGWPHEYDKVPTRITSSQVLSWFRNIMLNYMFNAESDDMESSENTEGRCKDYRRNPPLPCDEECERFRQLVRAWPKDKPKAAIYLLAQFSRLNAIHTVIKSISDFFTNNYSYPIIIFSDDRRLSKVVITKKIRSLANTSVFFQTVSFTLPSHIRVAAVPDRACSRGDSIGYRHMCRFQSIGVYHEPILADLEYTLRLDDDSSLTRPMKYDIFERMRQKQWVYGSIWALLDLPDCVKGLWQVSCRYLREQKLDPGRFTSWPYLGNYYNNFEVSRMSLWRSCEYQSYVDYLDRLGGIYYDRWGDGPIKSIAVAMLLPSSAVHIFDDIGYTHWGMPKVNWTMFSIVLWHVVGRWDWERPWWCIPRSMVYFGLYIQDCM